MIADPAFRFRAKLVGSIALQEILSWAARSLSIVRGQMLIDQLSSVVQSKRLADLVIVIVEKQGEKSGENAGSNLQAAAISLVNASVPAGNPKQNAPRAATILFAGRFPDSLGNERDQDDLFDIALFDIARSLSATLEAELCARGVQFVQWAQDLSPAVTNRTEDTLHTSNSIEIKEDSGSTMQDRWSRSLGFEKLATLCYMHCALSEGRPNEVSTPSLELVPISHQDADQLHFDSLVEQTYIGTLDCPSLSSFQTTSMTLNGYRASPTFASDLWFEVRLRLPPRSIVGCLVLARHRAEPVENPSIDIDSSRSDSKRAVQCSAMEVAYMGIIPAHRGCGLGRQLIQLSFDIARGEGCPVIILAVDTLNAPARAAYEAAGFVPILFEDVWGKRLMGSKTEASKNEST